MNKYNKEELVDLIFNQDLAYEEIGRKFNVTGNAIKKAARRLNIELPQRRKINESEAIHREANKKEDRLCELCGNILVSYQERFCSRQCKADMEYLIYCGMKR